MLNIVVEHGSIEKLIFTSIKNFEQVRKRQIFFIRVWIKFCEYKAIRKVDTMQQSCIGYATEFYGGMQQSCNNKLINNLEYKLDITTTNQDKRLIVIVSYTKCGRQ